MEGKDGAGNRCRNSCIPEAAEARNLITTNHDAIAKLHTARKKVRNKVSDEEFDFELSVHNPLLITYFDECRV